MILEEKQHFSREELYGHGGHGQSVHVIIRKAPYLFGPKSPSRVKFKRGIRIEGLREIGDLMRQGLSDKAIHRRTGVCRQRLRRIRNALEGEARNPFRRQPIIKPAFYSPRLEEIKRSLREGFSNRFIARTLRVSEKRVRRLRRLVEAHEGPFHCACGRSAGHKEVCAVLAGRPGRRYKLTPDIVDYVRRHYGPARGCTTLARQFGISEDTIRAAVAGKTWKSIPTAPVKIIHRSNSPGAK